MRKRTKRRPQKGTGCEFLEGPQLVDIFIRLPEPRRLPKCVPGRKYKLIPAKEGVREKGSNASGLPREIWRSSFIFLGYAPGDKVMHFQFCKPWGGVLSFSESQIFDYEVLEAR